jgi:predicted deacetylase
MFKASYLIRFDDISPFMNWEVWNQVELILDKYDIKPIVAIVPDCSDENIMIDPYNCNFWRKVKEWELKGWGIALHGYEHKFVTEDPGIIGINKYSEFAGLSLIEQECKIKKAIEIFKKNDCSIPSIWVAPAHSFDLITVDVLKGFGIKCISDSFTLFPYNMDSVFWIPQQLWRFKRFPFGFWTVCMHHNTWKVEDKIFFESQIKSYHKSIVDCKYANKKYNQRNRTFYDRIFSNIFFILIIVKKTYRTWFR